MKKSQKRTKLAITNRIPLFLQGTVSVVATSNDKDVPDITMFRSTAREAADLVGDLAKENLADNYVVAASPDLYDVYDSSGRLKALCSAVHKPTGRDPFGRMPYDREAVSSLPDLHGRFGGYAYMTGHVENRHTCSADKSNLRAILALSATDGYGFYRHAAVTTHDGPGGLNLFLKVDECGQMFQDQFLDEIWNRMKESRPSRIGNMGSVLAFDMMVHKTSEMAKAIGRTLGLDDVAVSGLEYEIQTLTDEQLYNLSFDIAGVMDHEAIWDGVHKPEALERGLEAGSVERTVSPFIDLALYG